MKTLEKVNLLNLVSDIKEYTNFIASEVNDHVLRIAVIEGEYHWHQHDTDELFMVLEGKLHIDLETDETISLQPGEIFTVPAKTQHRTRSDVRTVNICFETKENDIKGN